MGISKVIFGNETLIDLTADTVTPEMLAEGYTAHDASGAIIIGTAHITPPVSAKVYGAEWTGSSNSAWTRTDDASLFSNPQPYYSGMSGTPSSPFDDIEPWSGMVKSEDVNAGIVVAIPKFYYKMGYYDAVNNLGLKIQIAPASNGSEWASSNGFSVSPAHQDRGDGYGEREVVYVGRYHCSNSNYKSITGQNPKSKVYRSAARSSIHSLGSNVWQWDMAMLITIWMLYLVEYAEWDSQSELGGGCTRTTAVYNAIYNSGATDTMPYHSGTVSSSIGRTVYGANQYRYIENLWGNCFSWVDGIYFNNANIYAILNPSSFSDNANGTLVGTRPTDSDYISAFAISSVNGYEWFLYPSAVGGSETTYICDYCGYYSPGTVLRSGGDFHQGQEAGLFYLSGDYSATSSNNVISCRLMVLPNAA